jgi:hypothetical protein
MHMYISTLIIIKQYSHEEIQSDHRGEGYGIYRHFQQYISYILAVSFIGGGNRSTRRKPSTCRKSLTIFIT